MFSFIQLLLSCSLVLSCVALPKLNFDGFAWAENLCFDGIGHVFVSEAIRGELWRISLCANETSYCGGVYVEGFDMVGGMVATNDGAYLYAGVTFLDDAGYGIIKVPTAEPIGNYTVVVKTSHHPNGMAVDWDTGLMFFTDEGTGEEEGGTVSTYNIITGHYEAIAALVPWADGAWFDNKAKKLYVGELTSKKMHVFSIVDGALKLENIYNGLSTELSSLHLLDDFTLETATDMSNISSTLFFGADWTGRSIQKFSLDGTFVEKVECDSVDLAEPTSVRWGKGPGFDEKALYVSEGGGLTKRQTNRRVVQITML